MTSTRQSARPIRAGVTLIALALVLAGVSSRELRSQATAGAEDQGSYVLVQLDGEVDLGMAPLVDRALALAREVGARRLVLQVDTFGGRLDAAVAIRDALLESEIPTTCYVDKRAISAGALICLATSEIDMAPGSTIGAATPIRTGATDEPTAVDSKVTSYVRKEFGATAEARHRRRDLAEAMVDRDVKIEGTSGAPLTLTTSEAVSFGLAARSSASLDAAITAAGLGRLRRIDVTMNWAERAARFISNPIISGLLLTIGFLGLVVEIKTPGWGPGIVGGLALATFFFGHNVVQLAGWEELALIVVGVILLAVEIFVLPGFGVAGILGLLFVGVGVIMAMIGHDFELALAAGVLRTAVVTASSALLLATAGFVAAIQVLPRTRFARRGLLLDTTLAGTASFDTSVSRHLGSIGIARTMLRPAGSIVVGDERLDAVSEGDIIPAGSAIEVVGVRGGSLVVRIHRPAPGEASS